MKNNGNWDDDLKENIKKAGNELVHGLIIDFLLTINISMFICIAWQGLELYFYRAIENRTVDNIIMIPFIIIIFCFLRSQRKAKTLLNALRGMDVFSNMEIDGEQKTVESGLLVEMDKTKENPEIVFSAKGLNEKDLFMIAMALLEKAADNEEMNENPKEDEPKNPDKAKEENQNNEQHE